MVVGDEILSRTEFDPFAPVVVSRVEKLFRLYAPLWELRLGGQLIETTAEHPLFVDGRGWTAVRDLNPGDRVLGLDEQYTPVESVHSTTRETPVFNLRVANEHTYFVGADDWGFAVWVHNDYSLTRVSDDVWEVSEDASGDLVGHVNKIGEDQYQYVAIDGTKGKIYDSIEAAEADIHSWKTGSPNGLGFNGPSKRHRLNSVTQKTLTKEKNTVVEPGVDVAADVAAINAGKATRTGDKFEINGRTYGLHNGTLFPISGPGFHVLDRGGFKALGVLNKFGDTPEALEILARMGVTGESLEAARRAYHAGKR